MILKINQKKTIELVEYFEKLKNLETLVKEKTSTNIKIKKKINKRIGKLSSVKKVTKNKAFCSLIVGKDQDILFEKYAKDFSTNQPQTIMSITKMFIHLFVGELIDRKLINLNKKISFYLPKIGSGYANAKVKMF